MTTAVSSSASAAYVPASQPPEVTAARADASAPVAEPTRAASMPPAEPIADGTMAALVAEQAGEAVKAPLDLRGQDLRGADLTGLDLRGADLSGANLSGLDLTGLDLTGARLDGANLSGAIFRDTRLDGVSARAADLSGATLVNTTMNGADLSNARLDHAFIGKEDAGHIAVLDMDRRLVVSNVRLDGASLKGAHLQAVFFKESSAAGADFSDMNADVVTFRASTVTNANFDGVSGRKLSFFESDLSGAALTNTDLKNAEFSSTTLDGVRLAGTSLNGVSFASTNLSTADLTGAVREAKAATFSNTNLDGLDLSGFDFSGAIFNGNPTTWTMRDHREVQGAGASMNGTKFDGAKFDYAWFQGVDTSAGSFAGASFNAVAQGSSASSLAGVAGVGGWSLEQFSHHHALRGITLPTLGRTEAGVAREPVSPVAEAALEATGSDADLIQSTTKIGDQSAGLALDTLRSISAQMRAAQAERRTEPSAPWERLAATDEDLRQDGRELAIV